MNPQMQKIMGVLKTRWVPIVCVAAPVLVVGGAFFGASAWNESILSQAQARLTADSQLFKSPNLTYKLPGVMPADTGVEWVGPPNQVAVERFRAALKGQMDAVNAVVGEATRINKEGKQPLVAALFPDPPAGSQVAQRDMAREVAGPAHKAILKIMGAGGPASPADVASRVRDARQNFFNRLGPDAPDESRLSPEQAKALSEELVGTRLDVYRGAAQRPGTLVYAVEDAIGLPLVNADVSVPGMVQCWDWQMIYWITQDVARAVARVNAPAASQGIVGSTVKRVEKIAVAPLVPVQPIDPSVPAPVVDHATPDWSVSFTGRKSGPIYDVRNVTLTAVVVTRDLPKLLDAISATNLMTVLDVKTEGVDTTAELSRGFYYGPDHVSRVTMTIETLWLRGWTADLMPLEVKQGNGLAPMPGADPNNPGGVPPPMPAGG